MVSGRRFGIVSTLFSIVNERFFNVLSARNKELYLDCLFFLYDRLDQMTADETNTKNNVIDMLSDYLDSKVGAVLYAEDDADLSDNQTNRDKAAWILNMFVAREWLFAEDLGDYKTAVHFYTHSVRVIKTLKDIQDNDRTEYTGLISVIHAMLIGLSKDDIGQFEQIYKRTEELVSNLNTLRSNIFMHYNTMIKGADKDRLKDLFERLMTYKQGFFDTAFYNLMTKDTLQKYKHDIIRRLRDILDEEDTVNKLARARMNETYKTLEDAREFILTKTFWVIEAFENIERIIKTITETSQRYLNVAISKIKYLLNRSADLEGTFNAMFSYVVGSPDDSSFDFVRLTETGNLDQDSLYTARRVSEKIEPVRLTLSEETLDPELVEETMRTLRKNSRYSIRSINREVENILDGRHAIRASSLRLETEEDKIRLMLIYLYSRNGEATYTSESLGKRVTVDGLSFGDFVIKRRT
jgi:hypothetical protein